MTRGQLAVLIGGVIVDEGAARRFDDAHAFALVILAGVQDIGAEDVGVFAQDTHPFGGEQGFDQAGIVVVQGIFDGLAVVERS